jgi:hypothetical protein
MTQATESWDTEWSGSLAADIAELERQKLAEMKEACWFERDASGKPLADFPERRERQAALRLADDIARYNKLVDAFESLEPEGSDPDRFRYRSNGFMSARSGVRAWLELARSLLVPEGAKLLRESPSLLESRLREAASALRSYELEAARPLSKKPRGHSFGDGDLHYWPTARSGSPHQAQGEEAPGAALPIDQP